MRNYLKIIFLLGVFQLAMAQTGLAHLPTLKSESNEANSGRFRYVFLRLYNNKIK